MSSNPLIPDDNVVIMERGEWNGLVSLLRAYADGDPGRATAGTELMPRDLARNYADYIEEKTTETAQE